MPTPWTQDFSELLALLRETHSCLPPGQSGRSRNWVHSRQKHKRISMSMRVLRNPSLFPVICYTAQWVSLCTFYRWFNVSLTTKVRSLIQGHVVRKDMVSEETSSVKQGSENRTELRWQSSECSITRRQYSGLIPTVDLQGFGLQRLGVVKGNLQLTSL